MEKYSIELRQSWDCLFHLAVSNDLRCSISANAMR